jgi:hypothetical protein
MHAWQLTLTLGRMGGDAARALAVAALLALLLPLLPAVAAEQLAGWQPYHGHIALDAHAHQLEHSHPYEAAGASGDAGNTTSAASASVAFIPSSEGGAASGLSLALPAAVAPMPTDLAPPHRRVDLNEPASTARNEPSA